jgi:predicted HicB family RNase H-like nuclease
MEELIEETNDLYLQKKLYTNRLTSEMDKLIESFENEKKNLKEGMTTAKESLPKLKKELKEKSEKIHKENKGSKTLIKKRLFFIFI